MHIHLFIVAVLLSHQLVKHRAVILVDLLHLVDVARHLLHGLQRLCKVKQNRKNEI